jgi:hypothetical protein
MAITNRLTDATSGRDKTDSGRQYTLSTDYLTINYDDLTGQDSTAVAAFDIPAGATVLGGEIIVDTVFDSTTSDVLDLGDEADVNRYLAAVDLTTAARTAFVAANLGFEYTEPDTIDVVHTAGTADTAAQGSLRIRLEYSIQGRSNENER